MKREHRKIRTKRIYYGPPGAETSMYWKVRIRDATKPVEINGSVLHALESCPGVTIGCSLSNAAIDPKNRKGFSHPCHLVVMTASTAIVVEKLNRSGQPSHAVLYVHSYKRLTDKNDKGTIKTLIKEDPTLIERPFVLRVPRGQRPRGDMTNVGKSDKPAGKKAFIHRGALNRAEKAGLISHNLAKHLTDAAKAA